MQNHYRDNQEIDLLEVDQQLQMCDHVLAGPWIGEFGWELFCFQGYLRKLRHDNPHIKSFNVISRTGRGVLYEDFCDTYIEWDCPGTELTGALCMGYDATEAVNYAYDLMEALKLDKCLWIPTQTFIINYHADGPRYEEYFKIFNERQEFVKFGKANPEKTFDVIIHARSTAKFQSGDRNWPMAKWHELVKMLANDGRKIGCIGLEGQALDLPRTTNLLDIPLEETVQVLANSKFLVIPSLTESFSLAVGESLSVGTPVIVTNQTDWEVEKYNCGIKIKPDPEHLKIAMLTMIRKSNDEIIEMGNNGKKLIKSMYSPKKFKTKINDIIKEVQKND